MLPFNKIFAAALLLAAGTADLSASRFGYCTDVVSRDNIFRVGTSETQGMAIKLTKDKIRMLKGATISGISTAFGSSRTTDGTVTLFITTELDAEALVSQTSKISGSVKWIDFALDNKYTITGEEDVLYVGYKAEINSKSTMLMADHMDVRPDCSFVYGDGVWVDTQAIGCGNVSLRVNVDDAPAVTDLTMKSVALDGFFKAETAYNVKLQMFNFGSETIKSFDLAVRVGDEEIKTTSYTDVSITQGKNFDVDIPLMAMSAGDNRLVIDVMNVNGTDDGDASDNFYDADLFFYPSAMERSLLLEGFTGQYCSNCPAGHATVEAFLQGVDSDIIEVMHHSGYSPDFMTMDADLDYTYFYGSPSTYAPAVMLNRTTVSTIGSCPVKNVSEKNLETALSAVESIEPYVSLAVESTYDPSSREVNLSLSTYAHKDLPNDMNVFNVMLVQDGIVSYQVPYGSNYVHNSVFRGVLTDNSWGVLLPYQACAAGGEAKWSKTFVLPESIFSDYYDWNALSEKERIAYSIATEPQNMRIVAFVGSYSANELDGHAIYNAVSTKLGESHIQTGMASQPVISLDDNQPINIHIVDRRIIADTDYDSLKLYSIDGVETNADSYLTPGIYIVHAVKGNVKSSAKVLVK